MLLTSYYGNHFRSDRKEINSHQIQRLRKSRQQKLGCVTTGQRAANSCPKRNENHGALDQSRPSHFDQEKALHFWICETVQIGWK